MSDEGDGLPVVRVKFACANVEEFRRKFEANLLAKGMLARAPQMHEVGRRVTLRLELQDGSFGVDEEAVVQALEWTGGKQAMRLQLLRAKERIESTAPPPVAPSPVAAAPQPPAAPPPVAAPTPEWPRPAERARTDTETTRAMSLDELLNALPPTAKPKLTPSGEVPHLNGAVARPPPPAAPAPPAVPPPPVRPMTPMYPMAAYRAEPPGVGQPAFAPIPAPASVSTAVTQPGSIPLAAQPPPVAQPWESSPPPPLPSAPPSYAMTMAAFGAPAAAPEPAPPPPLDSVQATVIPTSNGVSRPSPATDLAGSIQDAIRPADDEDEVPSFTSATTAVNPATSAVTVSNPATSAVTASNATVAVDALAGQVQKAKGRGVGGAIATVLLLLAVVSGTGAYLWRTGQLGALAPALAARLPPSPATVATTPPPPPAPAPAPAAAAPAPTPAPAPEPVAAAPTPPAPPAPAPAETPKPAPVAAAPATPEPPQPPPAPAEPEVAKAKLTLSSTPPGAKVTADGQPVGVTPLDLDWPSGKPIKLRFSKSGFKSVTKAFTPKVNGTLDVELTSEAQENELKDVY